MFCHGMAYERSHMGRQKAKHDGFRIRAAASCHKKNKNVGGQKIAKVLCNTKIISSKSSARTDKIQKMFSEVNIQDVIRRWLSCSSTLETKAHESCTALTKRALEQSLRERKKVEKNCQRER